MPSYTTASSLTDTQYQQKRGAKMKFIEAKEKLTEVLTREQENFRIDGMSAVSQITYQNGEGLDCAEDDKDMRFASAELILRHEKLTEKEALGFCMLIDCKRRDKIDPRALENEIEGFVSEIEKLKGELKKSENVTEFITELARAAEAECAALGAELDAEIAKINRNTKLLTVTTVVIGIIVLIGVLVYNVFR